MSGNRGFTVFQNNIIAILFTYYIRYVKFNFWKVEEESLLHIWISEKAREKIEAIWVEEVDE